MASPPRRVWRRTMPDRRGVTAGPRSGRDAGTKGSPVLLVKTDPDTQVVVGWSSPRVNELWSARRSHRIWGFAGEPNTAAPMLTPTLALLSSITNGWSNKLIKFAGPAARLTRLRVQAWTLLKAACELADVRVLALRTSHHGAAGEPAPAHPHLFRHARVRQIVRTTRSLPLAQRQPGWSRLQMAYVTVGDEEARQLVQDVPE